MESQFITMAPHAWGKGQTPEESLKKCRQIYGPGMKDYDIYIVHPDTTVDGDGSFEWPVHPDDLPGRASLTNRPKLLQRVRKGKIQPLPPA